jgi:hypothetical protein
MALVIGSWVAWSLPLGAATPVTTLPRSLMQTTVTGRPRENRWSRAPVARFQRQTSPDWVPATTKAASGVPAVAVTVAPASRNPTS